jgi:hypothetical protein
MTHHEPNPRPASRADSLQKRTDDAAVAEYIHELSDRHRPPTPDDELRQDD